MNEAVEQWSASQEERELQNRNVTIFESTERTSLPEQMHVLADIGLAEADSPIADLQYGVKMESDQNLQGAGKHSVH